MIDFNRFTHLTFDCYGTLIDWETGILAALAPIRQRYGLSATDEQLLRLYAQFEAEQEAGPYKRYRDVLCGVMAGFATALDFTPTADTLNALVESVGHWPPFADTVEALRWLKTRYKLVIVSNIDDDLFAETNKLLQLEFDEIITAQQVGSYKPSRQNFRVALQRLGVPVQQVLHVAQSLYHDHVPAKELGFTTAWVNRKSRLPRTGLSLPVEIVPDLAVPDMRTLVQVLGG
jgi:2-haloacid dehalogenase